MEEINSYNLKDMAELEGKARQTIKSSFRYIPIRVYSPTIEKRCEKGHQKNPYLIKYIMLEDIKKALKGKVEISFNP